MVVFKGNPNRLLSAYPVMPMSLSREEAPIYRNWRVALDQEGENNNFLANDDVGNGLLNIV